MKYKLLANDGIDPIGKTLLEQAGFEVDTNNIPQDMLSSKLNYYDAVTVRSATKIRKDLIDACPNLKLIGRGGVGMDNIDVEYARSKGLGVYNTPAASSLSVAELVFSHLFTGIRFLHQANRSMPSEGSTKFGALKKLYADGTELKGKSIGIIGFGRIGREVAKIAYGLGMRIYATDIFDFNPSLELTFADGQKINFNVEKVDKETLIKTVDFISIHIPAGPDGKAAITASDIAKMKKGISIINCARGGVIDEDAIINGLNENQIGFVGLDVFENEPTPRTDLLNHPKISLSPHIGAATNEAQERIGLELAELIIHHFKA